MSEIEEVKAMIREMMGQEMKNFQQAIISGEEEVTMSPGVYAMLQVLLAKIDERFPACETNGQDSVSDGLEEAANEYCIGSSYSDAVMEKPAFKAGAHWQRQTDEHLIWQMSSANYEKGKREAVQQMMKDAVVASVNTYEEVGGEGYVEFVANIPVGQYKRETLVKLIIIKEE